MILVETLEDSHVVHHLADRGVDVGFQDGSRLTPQGSTPRRAETERHRLPLVLQENDDGHVRIYCDGCDCFWSWPLYQHASAQTNGDMIATAIDHALLRHRPS